MASLEDVVPNPSVRKPVYQVFAAVGILIGATQVGFAAAEVAQPVALTVALAVYAFLGGAGFILAGGNTNTAKDAPVLDFSDEELSEFEEPVQVPTAGVDPASTAKHA